MKKSLFDCSSHASILKGFSQGSPDYGAGMKFNEDEPVSLEYMEIIGDNTIQTVPAEMGMCDLDFQRKKSRRLLLYAQLIKIQL
jgi:hypothetical protein